MPDSTFLHPISEDFSSDIEENYCLMLSIVFRDALIEKKKSDTATFLLDVTPTARVAPQDNVAPVAGAS